MIVVTGAGGFIGSHLTERLLREGREVLALDLSASLPRNLETVRGLPGFRYGACDVKNPEDVRKAVPKDAEAVFHLASTVGVKAYVSNPLETIDTIVGGTRNLLDACLRGGARFVFLSTSEVFGKNPAVPWPESGDRVLGPPAVARWSYASSKGLCEHLVNAVHEANGLPTTIVRPFNVYGPRQRPDFVIPATVQKVLRGESPLLYDSGRQTRCFTYVGDLIEGLWRTFDTAAVGETFNFGREVENTVAEAVEIVIRVCGSPLRPTLVDSSKLLGNRYEDVPRRVPDASKARRLLGWTASTPLDKGVQETVEWARGAPEWLAAVPA